MQQNTLNVINEVRILLLTLIEIWQSCYKIISVERLSCAAFSIGSQLNASAAKGENLELRFTRPLLGAEVVVITLDPLLPQMAVTADKD